MKKIALIATVGVFVLSSCKKDYTCVCKTNGGASPITVETPIKDTKKKATSTCEKGNLTTTGIVTICELK
jgi:hypothetical protein